MNVWVYFFSKSLLVTAVYSKVSSHFTKKMSMKMSQQVISSASNLELTRLPTLVVFDLDMCLWSPEMYTLTQIPTHDDAVRGKLCKEYADGIIGVNSGSEIIRLFSGALQILQDIHAGKYSDMRIAIASSADTPLAVSIGRAALDILEVAPGVTVRDVFRRGWPTDFEGNVQIGRDYPLSKSKADTHFPILLRETGIPYQEMIFFDDCIWSDHCGEVKSKCTGVTVQATPRGIQLKEWWNALKNYSES